MTNVCVIGLGYVGTVTSGCLTMRGHTVLGVDLSQDRVELLNDGKSAFYEPGLNEQLQHASASGKLSATTNLASALDFADVAIISVGTPSDINGDTDLSALRSVVAGIRAHSDSRSRPLIVAVTSTVAPGTTAREFEWLNSATAGLVQVAFCPEFLREGTAIDDFLRPSLALIGCSSQGAFEALTELYESETASPIRLSIEEAESVKFVSNAWHALKVSFANEVGRYLKASDIDSQRVMNLFLLDTKLNVSARYLRPGFAYGGSCLPKDVRSLEFQTKSQGIDSPVFWAINESNQLHAEFALKEVLSTGAENVLLLGLAFKPNTSDLRESASLRLAEGLLKNGVRLSVFDRHVTRQDLENVSAFSDRIEDFQIELSLEDALKKNWDLVVVGQADRSFNSPLGDYGGEILDLAGSLYELQGKDNYSGLAW